MLVLVASLFKMKLILDIWLLRKQLDYQQKLHCLTRPMHSEVSTPAERLRNTDAKAEGQKPANAEVGDHRSRD